MQKNIQKPRNYVFTKDGYEKLQKEQEALLVKRKEVIETLKKAREMGDLSENGLYKAAKFELGDTDRKLRRAKTMLSQATIVTKTSNDTVGIGSTISVLIGEKKDTFTIVGDFEADPINKKISQNSPIGRALMGRKVGDTISFSAPSGSVVYTLLKIS